MKETVAIDKKDLGTFVALWQRHCPAYALPEECVGTGTSAVLGGVTLIPMSLHVECVLKLMKKAGIKVRRYKCPNPKKDQDKALKKEKWEKKSKE